MTARQPPRHLVGPKWATEGIQPEEVGAFEGGRNRIDGARDKTPYYLVES